MIRKLTLAIVIVSFAANATDNSIRILAVTTSDASSGEISSQLNHLVSAWNDSDSHLTTSVAIELVNGGSTSALLGGPLVGVTNDGLKDNALLPTRNLVTLRNDNSADIVILFTKEMIGPFCGEAWVGNWIQSGVPHEAKWIPDPVTGLDLNGSEDSWLAIVATEPSECHFDDVVAHEFGHLLGAGHHKTSLLVPYDTTGLYLLWDSHAWAEQPLPSRFGVPRRPEKTIMSSADASIQLCVDWDNGSCKRVGYFSSYQGMGNSAAENSITLDKTALSVANYRTSTPCGLSKPTNVVGGVISECWGTLGYSRYWLGWTDSCPDETLYYEVHKSFTSGVGPYQYGWDSWVVPTSFFTNTNGWLKVKACDSSGCSGLSESYLYAPYLCE
jgi:hypothetical protein